MKSNNDTGFHGDDHVCDRMEDGNDDVCQAQRFSREIRVQSSLGFLSPSQHTQHEKIKILYYAALKGL